MPLFRTATVYKLDLAWQRAASRNRAQTVDAAITNGEQKCHPDDSSVLPLLI